MLLGKSKSEKERITGFLVCQRSPWHKILRVTVMTSLVSRITFFGLLLITHSPPWLLTDWWIKEVDRPEKPYASNSPMMGKSHLEKGDKKKEFQKPVFWNLTPCELDLVHLRRPRICISETRSSVSFVVYGLWTTWGNIFHTFLWFFKKCALNTFQFYQIFSVTLGKGHVLKIKPF